MNAPYFIFHIRKTGGTSLCQMLKQYFKSDSIYHYHNNVEFYVHPITKTEETQNAKVIKGHMVYYGMHRDLGYSDDYDKNYIIFLRSPVERFLSYFNHLRNSCHFKGKPILTFDEWMETHWFRTQGRGMLPHTQPEDISIYHTKHILKNHTSFIGLTETFESDVNQLFHGKIPMACVNKSIDKTVTPVKFSDKELIRVREAVKDDFELYDYAVKLRNVGHNDGFSFPLKHFKESC